MRPHAAAGYGVAHHQVVEAGMRDEVEARQQGVGCGEEVVERLYQQRPVGLGQALEIAFAERAVVELPVRAAALDQPRFHIVAGGQLPHLAGRQEAGEAGYGVADQERALVPDIAQETGGAQATEQGSHHGRDYSDAAPAGLLECCRKDTKAE